MVKHLFIYLLEDQYSAFRKMSTLIFPFLIGLFFAVVRVLCTAYYSLSDMVCKYFLPILLHFHFYCVEPFQFDVGSFVFSCCLCFKCPISRSIVQTSVKQQVFKFSISFQLIFVSHSRQFDSLTCAHVILQNHLLKRLMFFFFFFFPFECSCQILLDYRCLICAWASSKLSILFH